ncbi:MAG: response regulator [Candidatus Acidiferrum sp.]|jgi:FixJ family two-component response regulator
MITGASENLTTMITQPSTKLIAVVDDDELVRLALQRLLKAAGFYATSFGSAEDLLKSGQLPEIECLIADIRMPGMSGLDLQIKLKAEGCAIPIIFITAHGDEKMRLQAMRAGAVGFLAKPFNSDVLLDRVRAALKVVSGDDGAV